MPTAARRPALGWPGYRSGTDHGRCFAVRRRQNNKRRNRRRNGNASRMSEQALNIRGTNACAKDPRLRSRIRNSGGALVSDFLPIPGRAVPMSWVIGQKVRVHSRHRQTLRLPSVPA